MAGAAVGIGAFGGLLGGSLGTLGGGGLGYALGGEKGRLAGGILGGLTGAIYGAGRGLASPFLAAKSYVGDNQQFFNESPYNGFNTSSNTANALSASGDIVLGMHNSRRGY